MIRAHLYAGGMALWASRCSRPNCMPGRWTSLYGDGVVTHGMTTGRWPRDLYMVWMCCWACVAVDGELCMLGCRWVEGAGLLVGGRAGRVGLLLRLSARSFDGLGFQGLEMG